MRPQGEKQVLNYIKVNISAIKTPKTNKKKKEEKKKIDIFSKKWFCW